MVSLTLRTDGDFLLSFFYPVRSQFVLGSLIGLGPLVAMLLVSFREKWWQGRWQHLARLIKPLIFVSLCADMVHQLSLASQHYWQFSWSVATFVIIDAVCVYWLITSHHLKVMINDWRNWVSVLVSSLFTAHCCSRLAQSNFSHWLVNHWPVVDSKSQQRHTTYRRTQAPHKAHLYLTRRNANAHRPVA